MIGTVDTALTMITMRTLLADSVPIRASSPAAAFRGRLDLRSTPLRRQDPGRPPRAVAVCGQA